MAMKPVKEPQLSELDQSIQIALDAADASMDVTAEFERVSERFTAAAESTSRLEKTSKTVMGVASGLAIVSILVMGVILQRSSSGLERLSATNTQILTILTENVIALESSVQPILEMSERFDDVASTLAVLQTDLANASQLIESFSLDVELIANRVALLETQEDAGLTRDVISDSISERISTLNGELAMNVSTAVRDALSRQSEDYKLLVNEFKNALDGVASGIDSSALDEMQKKMEDRLNDLNNRLSSLQRASPANPVRRSAPAAPEADTIKFP